jgi:hypothetical protein
MKCTRANEETVNGERDQDPPGVTPVITPLPRQEWKSGTDPTHTG